MKYVNLVKKPSNHLSILDAGMIADADEYRLIFCCRHSTYIL